MFDSLKTVLIAHKKDDFEKAQILNNLSRLCAHAYLNKLDSGLYYADQAILLSRKLSNQKTLADGYMNKAVNDIRKGEYTKADSLLTIAASIYTKIKSSAGMADNVLNRGLLNGVRGDFDACEQLSRQSLQLAEQSGDKNAMATAISYIGYAYMYRDKGGEAAGYFCKADSLYMLTRDDMRSAALRLDMAYNLMYHDSTAAAVSYLQKAEAYYIKDGNLKGLGEVYKQMGNIYENLNDYKGLVEANFKSLPIFEQTNNLEGKADCLIGIGSAMYHIEEYDNALKYLKESMALSKQIQQSEKGFNGIAGIVHACNRIANIYLDLRKPQAALLYLDTALSFAKRQNAPALIAGIYNNMGDAYMQQKGFAKAIQLYRYSLNYAEQADDMTALTNALNGIGEALITAPDASLREADITLAQRFVMARSYLQRSLKISENTDGFFLNQRLSLKWLSSLCEKEQHYEEALQYLHQYTDMQDTIINSDKAKAIIAQQIRSETQQKEQRIEELNQEKALRDIQLQNQRNVRNAFIAVAVLLLALIGVIISRYRLKRSIAIEKMQQRISSDLHDDIGASLTSINILSKLSNQKNIDETTRNNYLEKIDKQTAEITDALRDIVWSINPKNNTLDDVISRMRRYAAEMLESKNIEYSFETDATDAVISLDVSVRQNLYFIFKEAVNNLVKYSGAKNVFIKLTKNKNSLLLEIKEDGKGFDLQTVKQGNGLINMQRRAEAVNGKYELRSDNKNGTEITLSIPV